jgi:Ion channel
MRTRALVPPISKRRFWIALQARLREPSLTLLVVVQTFAIFVVLPLAGMHVMPAFGIGLMNGAIVLAVIPLTSADARARLIIWAAVIVDAASWFLRRIEPSAITLPIDLVARIIFLVAISVVLLRAVFSQERDGTWHRIQGGIAIYLNVALVFAMVFRLAALTDPNAFAAHAGSLTGDLSGFIYFSFSTLTTTGFGDIIPVSPIVRSASNLESVIGALFPATLLARLVVRYFT